MEFYYRKGEGITGEVSARWNGGRACRKKGKDFILGCFYVILNLEVGIKSMLLPISSGLWGGESGRSHVHTSHLCWFSGTLSLVGRNFHSNLTKDL
jgi:hypothetical protein